MYVPKGIGLEQIGGHPWNAAQVGSPWECVVDEAVEEALSTFEGAGAEEEALSAVEGGGAEEEALSR